MFQNFLFNQKNLKFTNKQYFHIILHGMVCGLSALIMACVESAWNQTLTDSSQLEEHCHTEHSKEKKKDFEMQDIWWWNSKFLKN